MHKMITNSRIVVTGGAGFIGSNLIDSLLGQGNEVVCLDNFSAGKRGNIAHHLANPLFTVIEGDIRDLSTCRRACDGADYVLHQAAVGSVPRSIEDPILSTEVNVMGFLNVLVASRDAKVKRFVYAASSSTYGDSTALPKVETQIGKPLSPYAITKYVDELYAGNFSELYGMEVMGLRYFNVYGARQDPFGAYAAVIPRFVSALLRHERPVINGDGTFSRDFTYVDDIVQINHLAALCEDPAAINTVYNAACGGRTSLNELIGALREHLGEFDPEVRSIQPIHGTPRVGDVPHSQASIEKAATLLGYAPRFGFSKGIAAAAKWYYDNLRDA